MFADTIDTCLDDPIFRRIICYFAENQAYDKDAENILREICHYLAMGTGTFSVSSGGIGVSFVGFPEDDEPWGGGTVRFSERDGEFILTYRKE